VATAGMTVSVLVDTSRARTVREVVHDCRAENDLKNDSLIIPVHLVI
jgi:hypothetical protein